MSERVLDGIKNNRRAVILLAIVLIVGMISIFTYFYQRNQTLAAEHNSLTATGTIEAKTVLLSFKVPGKIETLFVDEGSEVEEGQEVARLESREIEAQLLQAKGAYQAAEGQSGQADTAIPLTDQSVTAAIEQARAVVAKAEVNLTNSKQQYERVKMLHEKGAVSDSQFDQASNAYEAAASDLLTAQGKLDEALAARLKVDVAQFQYNAASGQSEQARGAMEEAQAYLDNTHLQSPISGYVTEKMLEEGEMLSAGTPVFEVSDIKNSYVKVFIDETKIGRVNLGQDAEVRVDSFPDRVFHGKVVWISDAGQFAVRKAVNEQYSHDIRSFEVKIDLPNDDRLLKTGMTAMVKILEEGK